MTCDLLSAPIPWPIAWTQRSESDGDILHFDFILGRFMILPLMQIKGADCQYRIILCDRAAGSGKKRRDERGGVAAWCACHGAVTREDPIRRKLPGAKSRAEGRGSRPMVVLSSRYGVIRLG